MSHSGTTVVSPTARSRLAQMMGFPGPSEPSSSKRDSDDWYIPYNGPIEPPRIVGRPRGNTFGEQPVVPDEAADTDGNWDEEDNTFGYGGGFAGGSGSSGGGGAGGRALGRRARATSSATRKSYASSISVKSPRGGGIGEAPVHSAASTRDRESVYSARAGGDRASNYSTRDRSSDERERGDQHAPQRGSIASFLTFGQSSSRRRPSINISTAYASSGMLPSPRTSRQPDQLLSPVSPPPTHGLSPVSPRSMRRSEESVFAFPTTTRARRSEDSASGVQVHIYAMPGHHTNTYHQTQHRGRQRSGTVESTRSATARPMALSLTAADRAAEKKAPSRGEAGGRSVDTSAAGTMVKGGSSSGQYRHRYGESQDKEGGAYSAERGVNDREQKAHEPTQQVPFRTLSHSASNPAMSVGSQQTPQRHPYAVAFPSVPLEPSLSQPQTLPDSHSKHSPPSHKQFAAPSIVLPSHFSTTTVSTGTQPRRQHTRSHATPANTATISPAAIAAAINTTQTPKLGLARSLLRPGTRSRPQSGLHNSVSTPNLRGIFRMGGGGGHAAGQQGAGVPGGSKPAKTQYAAETWCDALMFPRPRFRAHVISPPISPTDNVNASKGVQAARKDGATLQAPGLSTVADVRPALDDKPPLRRAATTTAPNRRSPSPPHRPHTPPPTAAAAQPVIIHISPGKQEHVTPGSPRTPTRTDYLLHDPHPTPPQPPELSPAEETLRRVMAEGEQRDKERETWNEIARTSFQNRRSRSLSRSRSRKRSGPTVRIRVDSEAGATKARGRQEKRPEGLGRLTAGLASLAAEAFNQPTPTISTASTSHSGGTSDSIAHSRNTSGSVSQGHARSSSWGKAALKKLCAPEVDVFSDAAVSPQQEKLEGALLNEKTAKMRVRGRREEAEEADVQFLDIGPRSSGNDERRKLIADNNHAVDDGSARSRSQNSNNSDALDVPVVGIALSTPPIPSPSNPDLVDLSAHPYAQTSTPRFRAGPVPIAVPYAGAHPTSSDYNRHRLLPHAQMPGLNAKPPELRMYAQTRSGVVRQVSTPEITQSPTPWIGSPGAHAYGNVAANDKRESTLGVEEALMSRMFQRGGGSSVEDSGFGSAEDHDTRQSPPRRELTPPPATAGHRVPRKPVTVDPFSGIPSLSHTVTTAAATDLPEPEVVRHVIREQPLPSPSSLGSTSTQTSPRHMSSADDLEPFRDLFYKPGQSSSDNFYRTPSSERRRRFGSRETSASYGDDRINSGDGLNGLRGLARQLSDERPMSSTENARGDEENRPHVYGQRLGEVREERLDGHSPSLPGLHEELSLHMGSPLVENYDETQDFPEDIESSRASSDIEHGSIDETLRFGTVPLAVPQPTHTERRQSTALSIGDTVDDVFTPNRDTIMTGTSSLGIPTTVDALLRTSFATSTSTASHMSNLIGDFPTPPVAEGVTPPSAATLTSYFVSPDTIPVHLPRRHPSLEQATSVAKDNRE